MPPIATVWTVTDARRGEIWLLDLGEPLGHEQGWQRPALILSSDRWNRHAATVTVLPLTRTKHGLPTRIEIEPDDDNGLDETSYARCEDVRSVSERRLTHRVGMVDDLTMSRVGPVLRRFLEIS
jgi:mRNA interferase MazF